MPTPARRGCIDRSELAILAAFAALSIWVLALVLGRAIAFGRIWTGTDGVGLQDQMQYLAWIQDTSRHVLASNLFVLSPTPHDYLQPLVAISGLLTALGVPAWLTLLMWKPVAVVTIFFAIRTYVHRVVIGAPQRLTALILALFFVGPGLLIANAIRHLGLSGRLDFQWHDVTLDPWIGWWSWGYPFGLIGLAAMLAGVLAYSREREEEHAIHLSPFLGALAAWLHPWQGATLIVILVVCEVGDSARTRLRARLPGLVVTCTATAVPLLYYAVLARTDNSWRLGQEASRGSWSLWVLALCELPLVLPAVVAYASRAQSFLQRTTRVWPIAAFAVFVFLKTTNGGFALHALLGINIPLAVLAVQGWGTVTAGVAWMRRPALAWFVVAALVVPALAVQLRWANQSISASAQAPPPRGHGDAKFISDGERHALNYLERFRGPGGVLNARLPWHHRAGDDGPAHVRRQFVLVTRFLVATCKDRRAVPREDVRGCRTGVRSQDRREVHPAGLQIPPGPRPSACCPHRCRTSLWMCRRVCLEVALLHTTFTRCHVPVLRHRWTPCTFGRGGILRRDDLDEQRFVSQRE